MVRNTMTELNRETIKLSVDALVADKMNGGARTGRNYICVVEVRKGCHQKLTLSLGMFQTGSALVQITHQYYPCLLYTSPSPRD